MIKVIKKWVIRDKATGGFVGDGLVEDIMDATFFDRKADAVRDIVENERKGLERVLRVEIHVSEA